MRDGIRQANAAIRCATLYVVACGLVACGQGVSNSALSNPATSGTQPSSSTPTSVTLTLSGTPPASVAAGSAYSFQPTVSESSGTVQFSITGIPGWAAFDATTGALSGTPSSADEGTSGAITITETDGEVTSSIGPFTIDVTAPATPPPTGGPGTATLTWSAPTTSAEGSSLSGYIIKYGTSVEDMSQSISISSGSTTSYEISNLPAGTYYFEVVASYADGTQSAASNVGGLVIT